MSTTNIAELKTGYDGCKSIDGCPGLEKIVPTYGYMGKSIGELIAIAIALHLQHDILSELKG